jgi:hypothetical protein
MQQKQNICNGFLYHVVHNVQDVERKCVPKRDINGQNMELTTT